MSFHLLIESIRELLVLIPAVFTAITVYEYTQGYIAFKLGDRTPVDSEMLKFNPLLFIEPVGFLMFILFHFGWSRPITIDIRNFKNPVKSGIIVYLGGIFSNLLVGFFFMLLIVLYKPNPEGYIYELFMYIIKINFNFFLINLLPILPFGLGRIVSLFYPEYSRFEFIGFILFILLLISGVITLFDRIVFNFIDLLI